MQFQLFNLPISEYVLVIYYRSRIVDPHSFQSRPNVILMWFLEQNNITISCLGPSVVESVKGLVAQLCLPLCDPMDSEEFCRQEYWRGLPGSPPGTLPDPRIKPGSPALQADSLLAESPGKSSRSKMSQLSVK